MKTRKIPTRKCIGCGENKEKPQLIRIVKNKENEIFIDKTGKANGRGVYICNSSDCFKKAITNKEIERSLKSKVEKDIYNELLDILENK